MSYFVARGVRLSSPLLASRVSESSLTRRCVASGIPSRHRVRYVCKPAIFVMYTSSFVRIIESSTLDIPPSSPTPTSHAMG
jgi:hypothetical protein